MMDGLPEQEMPRPLRTGRLELRPLTRDELEAVAAGRALPHFAEGFPSPADRDWARGAIEAGGHFFTESPYSRYAAVELASGEVVGTGGFSAPPMNGELEIEGSVAASRRGRGLAAEGLRAVVARAFEDPRVLAVHASVPPVPADDDAAGPEPARRVLLGAGFTPSPSEGVEDVYRLPRP
ncbi:hypothetical protein KVA01_03480 [Kocuria varians]|uniref:N-acetyltransferase domain-containing protein n=1 Tax=Kocuria varians TaxID=1272 RepID=A0A4Y4D3Q6_KOCVA|nr:GNAT family N-acetyltransferase [Kocuria varians]GEC98193.1 hypothetical protein KVA01_03480 [Kocuria varians]